MSNIGLEGWGIIAFSFGLLMMSSFSLGTYLVQLVVRLIARKARASSKKWQEEGDLYGPINAAAFAIWGLVLVLTVAFVFFWILWFAFIIVESPACDEHIKLSALFVGVHFEVTLNVSLFALGIGLFLQFMRASVILEKVKALDGLREVFHQRFSKSEILSMYEGLRQAPPLFWEEYINLPDYAVSQETNRKFRERISPFRYSQSRSHNRYMLVAMAITIGLAVISVVLTFTFRGGSI